MTRAFSILVGVVLTSLFAHPAPAGLINGDFESPSLAAFGGGFIEFQPGVGVLPGWTVEAGSVDVQLGDQSTGTNGPQYLDLHGFDPGTLSQVMQATAGQTYQLTFDYSGYTDVGLLGSGEQPDLSAIRRDDGHDPRPRIGADSTVGPLPLDDDRSRGDGGFEPPGCPIQLGRGRNGRVCGADHRQRVPGHRPGRQFGARALVDLPDGNDGNAGAGLSSPESEGRTPSTLRSLGSILDGRAGVTRKPSRPVDRRRTMLGSQRAGLPGRGEAAAFIVL